MKSAGIVFLVVLFCSVMCTQSSAHVSQLPRGLVEHKFEAPREVVQTFLQAVERGELIVFEQRLDAAKIVPLRVEYVYELNSAIPRVKVFSRLVQPLPVPGQSGCQVRAVSAVLDEKGTITEIEIHVWAEST